MCKNKTPARDGTNFFLGSNYHQVLRNRDDASYCLAEVSSSKMSQARHCSLGRSMIAKSADDRSSAAS